MSDPIFGPLVDPSDVQAAVQETLEEWIETYLAVVERAKGLDPKSMELPASYVQKDDGALNKRPEDELPCVAILCPGTAGDPTMDGSGLYTARWVVNVAVIVTSGDQDFVSDYAKFYAAAIRAALVQNGSLGGFAKTTVWRGERNDDLRPEDDRTMAAGTNVFEVMVPDVVQRGAGLKAPPAKPYEESELPTVESVEVELKPEEIA